MVDRISKDPNVVALFAFGSLATGRLKPISDLDFGILVSQKLSRRERFDKHLDLIGMFNAFLKTDEVDLVLMNDAPLKFCYVILKTGRLLQCSHPEDLIDFSERTVKLYLDFRFFRDDFDRKFMEGLGYRG